MGGGPIIAQCNQPLCKRASTAWLSVFHVKIITDEAILVRHES